MFSAARKIQINFGDKEESWLGWQDSNLRMAIPKTAALPLGHTPSLWECCIAISFQMRKPPAPQSFHPNGRFSPEAFLAVSKPAGSSEKTVFKRANGFAQIGCLKELSPWQY
jgi:hypothetical protein